MSVSYIKGNIFTSECKTLVNTVNCVGVMGAGIALECRLRFPDMHKRYLKLCQSGQLSVGKLWLFKGSDRWILNFPTKIDWKSPSKTEYLRSGLSNFVRTYNERGIQSIAFPILGADRGGLSKEVSVRIMREYLDDLPLDIEIYEYDPLAMDDLFPSVQRWIDSRTDEEISELAGLRKDFVARIRAAISRDDINQLNQVGRVRGIGIKTMERLFSVAIDSVERGTNFTGSQNRLL